MMKVLKKQLMEKEEKSANYVPLLDFIQPVSSPMAAAQRTASKRLILRSPRCDGEL